MRARKAKQIRQELLPMSQIREVTSDIQKGRMSRGRFMRTLQMYKGKIVQRTPTGARSLWTVYVLLAGLVVVDRYQVRGKYRRRIAAHAEWAAGPGYSVRVEKIPSAAIVVLEPATPRAFYQRVKGVLKRERNLERAERDVVAALGRSTEG